METLSRCGYLPCLRYADFSHCEHCIYGKHTQTPHKRSLSLKSDSLDLVHSDVCEMPQLSLGGKRYFVSFIDDATRKVWVYPLRVKSDVLDTFKKFLAFVENQTGKKLRSLRSDNGREYVFKAFIDFCTAKGIKREPTAPFNPSQNGVAERLNRTIQEKVRSMLSHAALPHGLEPKSSKCIFLGYGEDGEMGYRLWDPALRKIIHSNDVIFNENCMHKQPTKVEEVRRVVFREDVTYGQPRRPNVQQPLHAENGAENQQ
ncbi:hypothetical protein L7F22_008730 [Adiantum nelumboides]|nr:hypothetical protein [Adiantum nelumboides]